MAAGRPTQAGSLGPAEELRDAELLEDLHDVVSGRADEQRPGALGRLKLEDHAASSWARSTSLPHSKRAPARTRATRWGAFTQRHRAG